MRDVLKDMELSPLTLTYFSCSTMMIRIAMFWFQTSCILQDLVPPYSFDIRDPTNLNFIQPLPLPSKLLSINLVLSQKL